MKVSLIDLRTFIKRKHKLNKLIQPKILLKARVGMCFLRDMEQGKKTLCMDKVSEILRLFGDTIGPVLLNRGKLIN